MLISKGEGNVHCTRAVMTLTCPSDSAQEGDVQQRDPAAAPSLENSGKDTVCDHLM